MNYKKEMIIRYNDTIKLEKERERNIKRDLELKRVLSELKTFDNNNMVKPTEDKPKKKKNLTLVKKTSNNDDNTKALKELEKLLLNNYKILNQKSRPTAQTHYDYYRDQIYQSSRDGDIAKNLEVFKKLINDMITKLKSKEDKPKEDKPKPKKKLKQTMEIKFKKKKEYELQNIRDSKTGRYELKNIKKLVPKTVDDEDKLFDLRQDIYRQKNAKEELEQQKKVHKMIENFFNNDGGVYKKSLDVYSGDALKNYLDKMERGGIFKIDPELKKKIYKKLKIK